MKKLMVLLGAVVILIGGIYWATLQANDQPTMLADLAPSALKEKMTKKENFSIYVYSDTCVHCKEFKPILEDYLTAHDVNIYRVSVTQPTEHKIVSELLGDKFQGTPSIFSFKDGEMADYFVGAQPKEALEKYAQKNKDIFTI